MPERLRLGVSVVTFHSDLGLLALTSQALGEQSLLPWRTRVHVNEATPGEREQVELACAAAPGLVVGASATNQGFSGGHNANLAALFEEGADAVLVLNPDLRLGPGAAMSLCDVAEQYGGSCLVGPLLEQGGPDLVSTGLIDSAGIRWTSSARHLDRGQGSPLSEAPRSTGPVAGLTGACLLVPRAAYERVMAACGELFDADFVAYREDAELSLRTSFLGLPSVLCVEARGVHARGLRGTARSGSALINRLGVQNRFLILFKHGRARPGNLVLSAARDLVVLVGAATVERTSWAGVKSAWALRRRMRDKRRALEAAVR